MYDPDDLEDDDDTDDEEIAEALSMVGDDEEMMEEEDLPKDADGIETREKSKWSYKKARWVGKISLSIVAQQLKSQHRPFSNLNFLCRGCGDCVARECD